MLVLRVEGVVEVADYKSGDERHKLSSLSHILLVVDYMGS